MPVVFIGVVPWRDATIAMLSENAYSHFGQGTPTHLQDVIQCLCVLRCDNIRHVMPIWANQVSPLQNWYPIIYIHNDMINSVRNVDLGEACLARKKHIITCSGAPWHAVIEPRRMARVGLVSPMWNVGQTGAHVMMHKSHYNTHGVLPPC